MQYFNLNNLNAVVLKYVFEKYDDGNITIQIMDGKPILTVVDIRVLGARTTENFNQMVNLKNFIFKPDESFQVFPDLINDENEHFGQIYFEGNTLDNYYFQDIISPLKELLIEEGTIRKQTFFGGFEDVNGEVLKGGGKLYFDILWRALNEFAFSNSNDKSVESKVKAEKNNRKPVWKGVRKTENGDVWEILELEYSAGELFCKSDDENGQFEVSGRIDKANIYLEKKYENGKLIRFEASSRDGSFFDGKWTSDEGFGIFSMFKPLAIELN